MAIQMEPHSFKGMQRDLSKSKFSPEFVFEAMNIRLTAREDNTLLSVTNEKGNAEVTLSIPIEGTVIGHYVLNNYLVLFTIGLVDRIYRLEYNDGFSVTKLYEGSLNFNTNNPIECVGIYENEEIQKIYWVDGRNPVRFINITRTYDSSYIFNIAHDLVLDEIVTVTSNKELKGSFPSGVVQYVFTYFNKHGAESNIFHHSPLVYAHRSNRGGSPEEVASNSFDISITELETKFDYVRIYSIVRTSINAIVSVKKVADLSTKSGSIFYTDNNTTGETVDPTVLLYLGGENIIPECITHKDNTLFLGNYTLPTSTFNSTDEDNAKKGTFTFAYKQTPPYERRKDIYDYSTQLDMNSYEITSLKANETYRFGIQFQNRIGRWSEVLWIGDNKVTLAPTTNVPTGADNVDKLQTNTLVKAQYTLPSSIISKARSLGYIRARGVIVYPTTSDRDIVCQGILNPTIYKADDRDSNSPYAQSSWFFRPYTKSWFSNTLTYRYGSVATYTDKASVNKSGIDLGQGPLDRTDAIEVGTTLSYTDANENTYDKDFYVDSNIVTMHSPDIEFQDTIDSFTDSNLTCTIVGYIDINNTKSFRDLQVSTSPASAEDFGFYDTFPESKNYTFLANQNGGILISAINWIGSPITKDGDKNEWKVFGDPWGWMVSPWQRSGSLVNDFAKRGDDAPIVSKLKHNRTINTRVSYETYINKFSWQPPKGISKIAVFDSEEQALVFIGDTEHAYYGNIDKVVTPGSRTYGKGADAYFTNNTSLGPSVENLFKATAYKNLTNATESRDIHEDYKYAKDPVSIKYKSTKHIVFEFNKLIENSKERRVLLPSIGELEYYPHSIDEDAYYDTLGNTGKAVLWLAELSRTVPDNIKFGGKSKDALLNNKWNIAGNPVCLQNDTVTVEYLQGDTYLQRYDCLKTYPYSLEDENNVTEILSFFCETRVNIDGRYDRNRRNFNNLALSPNTFNLLNPVYSQSNNYFNYYILDPSLKINNFKNSITWSKEKSLGEEVDQWTNITLASTLDLDGDKGNITALKTFNNEIYCFQDRGLSNILFNSRVQIPASDGVPIEITNGLKVQGKRYISNHIGCNNKWSITESPSGLYFIDNHTDSIYLFDGQLNSLSDNLGFGSWIKEQSSFEDWNPVSFNNFISYYDKANKDVYFINSDKCLCYSEKIGQFTSFMSYEGVYPLFNIKNNLFSIKNNKVWKHFAGKYNTFYGSFKPYSITFIANSNPTIDKIFNTIEFRSDSWENGTLLNETFDTLDVWNEYQQANSCLEFKRNIPSNLKRKFRIWRANIPRDSSNNRDRIRNTWAYIKLSMNNSNTWKTEFHDINISYFM